MQQTVETAEAETDTATMMTSCQWQLEDKGDTCAVKKLTKDLAWNVASPLIAANDISGL